MNVLLSKTFSVSPFESACCPAFALGNLTLDPAQLYLPNIAFSLLLKSSGEFRHRDWISTFTFLDILVTLERKIFAVFDPILDVRTPNLVDK
jgi:hypothetical protein